MNINALTKKNSVIANCVKTQVKIENPINLDAQNTLGIWDTGATNSCITSELAKKLNLTSLQKALVNGVHGQQEVNVYLVRITLNNENITIELLVTEAAELSPDHKTGILIGMDVISKGDFCISNFKNETTMTFRVPSLECVDYVSEINEYKRIVTIHKVQSKKGIEKCPCNSGKLFKNCCQNSKYNQ